MTRDKYEAARLLRMYIMDLDDNLNKIMKMKARMEDQEFSELRQLAFDAINALKKKAESDFSAL